MQRSKLQYLYRFLTTDSFIIGRYPQVLKISESFSVHKGNGSLDDINSYVEIYAFKGNSHIILMNASEVA